MMWSLSEFLSLFEFRSQSWCFVKLGDGHGLRLPHADVAFCHAVLRGKVRLSGVAVDTLDLAEGDVAITLSGKTHALRQSAQDRLQGVPLLDNGEYVDSPPTVTIGPSPAGAVLLCGRLKVRWPGGKPPRHIPPVLRAAMVDGIVDLGRVTRASASPGGASLLTRMATLQFVDMFRQDPSCLRLFDEAEADDPIARAQRYIELHPFQKWTVEILAQKVGMSRSNFASRFSSQTGVTPMEALTAQRMRHAAHLLANTDLKIAEVGERVAYKSEAAFYLRFVRHFGVPPGQMRKQSRAEDLNHEEHGST